MQECTAFKRKKSKSSETEESLRNQTVPDIIAQNKAVHLLALKRPEQNYIIFNEGKGSNELKEIKSSRIKLNKNQTELNLSKRTRNFMKRFK